MNAAGPWKGGEPPREGLWLIQWEYKGEMDGTRGYAFTRWSDAERFAWLPVYNILRHAKINKEG